MQNIKLFLELTRLNRPIGYMLLFWPCLWGLTIAYDFNSSLEIFYFYSFLFLMGSILMRSAGCIVNDIVDRNFDKKVHSFSSNIFVFNANFYCPSVDKNCRF